MAFLRFLTIRNDLVWQCERGGGLISAQEKDLRGTMLGCETDTPDGPVRRLLLCRPSGCVRLRQSVSLFFGPPRDKIDFLF